MIRRSYLIASIVLGAAGLGLVSCSEDSTNPPADTEFVATDADFAPYETWSQTTTPRRGPDPAGQLGGWHDEADTNITRYIYINNASATRGSNGQYPKGTVIVKAMRNAAGTTVGLNAMVKRGAEYSKSNNGWEYFRLNPTTKGVIARGDTLEASNCKGCHATVKDNKDYVFTK